MTKKLTRKKPKPPTVKQLVSRVEKEFGAKAGTAEMREAIEVFNEATGLTSDSWPERLFEAVAKCQAEIGPGWLVTVDGTNERLFLQGYRDRFFNAREEAIRILNGLRIKANPKCVLLSIDGVTMKFDEGAAA